MSYEGIGKFYEHVKGRMFLYIPAKVRQDSQFPFKMGESVTVKIEGKKMIVEKVEE